MINSSGKGWARAKWRYLALEQNELSFRKGDVIELIDQCNEDWMEGRLGSAVGFFPANRVEVLSLAPSAMRVDSSSPTPPPPLPPLPPGQSLVVSPLRPTEHGHISTTTPLPPAIPDRDYSLALLHSHGSISSPIDFSRDKPLPTTVGLRELSSPPPSLPPRPLDASLISPLRYTDMTHNGDYNPFSKENFPGSMSGQEFIERNDEDEGSPSAEVGVVPYLGLLTKSNKEPKHFPSTSSSSSSSDLASDVDALTDVPDIRVSATNSPLPLSPSSDHPALQELMSHLQVIRTSTSASPISPIPMEYPYSDWAKAFDDKGEPYFWNMKTQETSWTLPSPSTFPPHSSTMSTTLTGGTPSSSPKKPEQQTQNHQLNSPANFSSSPSVYIAAPSTDPMHAWSTDSIPNASTPKSNPITSLYSSSSPLFSSSPSLIAITWPVEPLPLDSRWRLKEGNLGIKSKAVAKFDNWHHYPCIVIPSFLIIHSKTSCLPIYAIDLSKSDISRIGKESTKKKFAFHLSVADLSFYLVAENERDLFVWMDTLTSTPALSTRQIYAASLAWIMAKQPSNSMPSAPSPALSASTLTAPKSRPQKFAAFLKNKLEKYSAAAGAFKKEPPIFGGSLADHVKLSEATSASSTSADGLVPLIVRSSVEEIERRGLSSQGIYRISGNAATIQKMKTALNNQERIDFTNPDIDLNVLTGLLKCYLRELSDPLIPFSIYQDAIDVMKSEDSSTHLEGVKSLLVSRLPRENFALLRYLCQHLCRVMALADKNKMLASNLAIVFGPTLLRPPEGSTAVAMGMLNMMFQTQLVEILLIHYSFIFEI